MRPKHYSYAIEGMRNEELRQQLQSLEGRVDAIGTDSGGGGSPTPCAGGIMLTDPTTQLRLKRVLNVSLCVNIPSGTARLAIIYIRVADVTSANAYNTLRKKVGHVVEESIAATGGEYSFLWKANLEYATAYRVIRIIVIPRTGDEHRTFYPATEQAWNDPVPAILLFTTPEKFGVPSSPSLSLLTTALDPGTVAYDAYAETKVYAPLTDAGAAQSWGAAGVDQVHAVLRMDGKVLNPHPHILSDEELTQVDAASSPANRGFVIIRHGGLIPGRTINWVKNIAYTNGERRVSTGAAVAFGAGGLSNDPNLLTGMSLTVQQTNRNNPKSVRIIGNFTQPSPTPVALAWGRVRVKELGQPDSSYETMVDEPKISLQRDDLHTVGTKTAVLVDNGKLNPNKTWTLEFRIKVREGGTKTVTQNVGTGADPDVANDTVAPGGFTTPVISYRGGIHYKSLRATTNIHTLKDVQVVLSNSTGTFFFDLNTYTTTGVVQGTSFESVARFSIDRKAHGTLVVRLKHLKQVFGATGVIKLYAFFINDIGEARGVDSNLFGLSAAADVFTASETINVIDVSLAPPGKQLLKNTDNTTLSAGNLTRWFRWDGVSTPISSNTAAINSASSNIRLNEANHSVLWVTTTQYLVYNLKKGRVMRGQFYNFNVALRFNTPLVGLELRLFIKTDNGVDNIDNLDNPSLSYARIALDGLGTSYVGAGGPLKVKDFADLGSGSAIDQWLVFQLAGPLGSNQLEWDHAIFVRGQQAVQWCLQEDEESLDYLPTGLGAIVDIPNVMGARGNYFSTPGDGGLLVPDLAF